MDPTKAVVTNPAGAAASVGVSIGTGASAGSIVPGIGTVGGAFAGLVLGGAAAYLTTTGLKKLW